MFRSIATIAHDSSPVLSDWTTRELLEWIGEEDTRCHDTTLLALLAALDDTLAARAGDEASGRTLTAGARVEASGRTLSSRPGGVGPGLTPTSPAPLVRALGARLRAEPPLRDVRVRDLVDVTAQSPAVASPGDPGRGAPARPAASVPASIHPRQQLRVG